MGPLAAQEIISQDWNLFLALLIGIAFGFVLEQAGFSSTRKLAGVFYGYDMVVLKVFFTAAITAMLGLLYLSLFGWIDLELVYVNPLYLWPTIVGGIIMGMGFIVGGFCPGTSVCAAAIGKIDAMVFVGGIFIGVFLFAELYPALESFYFSGNMGSPRVFESLGISMGIFALILSVVAALMFLAAEKVESFLSKGDSNENA